MISNKELLKSEKGPKYNPFGKNIRTALVYPNFYSIGMSNLGFQTIYHLLNSYTNTYCERIFLSNEEKIYSFENNQSLNSFNFIFFSLSFEGDYPNIVKILDKGNIPVFACDRDETHPVIAGGGVCAFLNPEPVADFFDYFVIGEAEEVLSRLIDIYDKNYSGGFKTKKERESYLIEISKIEGVYVPQFYNFVYNNKNEITSVEVQKGAPSKIKRLYIKDLDSLPILPQITSPHLEFGDMFLLEVGRGCPFQCNFCGATSVYKPYRFRSLETIKKIVRGQKGIKTFGLISPAVSCYPKMEELFELFYSEKAKTSFSSLRIDKIDDKLALLLSENNQSTITLAPECGSQRMRNMVNKKIEEEDILMAIENLAKHKIKNIKLYFMIGLPEEKPEDIEAIYALTQKIRDVTITVYKKTKYLTKITIHITPYVPKPHTPWQDISMSDEEDLRSKLHFLHKSVSELGSIKLEAEDVKNAILQSVYSRGDRKLAEFIIALSRSENKNWKIAGKKSGFAWQRYLSTEHYGKILPWELISE
ncbi:MAG: radical SAM protein [bacterium]|nr:radical SAM protein [bacterium]